MRVLKMLEAKGFGIQGDEPMSGQIEHTPPLVTAFAEHGDRPCRHLVCVEIAGPGHSF